MSLKYVFRRRPGFTLIELIVVIAIIAILAAIIAPNAFKAIEKSRVAKTQADLKALKAAIAALYADTGKFPNGCPAFSSANPEINLNSTWAGLVSRPPLGIPAGGGTACAWEQSDLAAWDGPYIDSNGAEDVWRNAYRYDPDYARCSHRNCPDDEDIFGASCWAPPVLLSRGPDGTDYTCDDIVVLMTLQ